jgi:hypothetical protein
MKYDFFIASRWRNKDSVLELTEKIREKGKMIYYFFEGDGTDYTLKALEKNHDSEVFMQDFENISDWQNSSAVREIFDVDMNALRESENLILLLPAGKLSHVEAGVAYGMGKKCVLVGEQKEAESLYMIFSEFYKTIDDLISDVEREK